VCVYVHKPVLHPFVVVQIRGVTVELPMFLILQTCCLFERGLRGVEATVVRGLKCMCLCVCVSVCVCVCVFR